MKILARAIEIIEKGWTQGAAAKDAEGNDVGVDSEKAVSFCLVGAFTRAETELNIVDVDGEYTVIKFHVYNQFGMGLPTFNDTRKSKEEVLEVLRHIQSL
jgi:hypothetical protein